VPRDATVVVVVLKYVSALLALVTLTYAVLTTAAAATCREAVTAA
jgi:hypothetical protein